MIITTTHSIDGKQISEYLGLVSGASLYNAGGLLGGGYTSSGQSLYFQSAVQTAIKTMCGAAPDADAIVGVQTVIGTTDSGMNQVIVTATGTAVRLTDKPNDDELPEL